tara:strand:+ start:1419 stop:1955 length:537 start_codon:yes stop_codon:yes gene_type:complete
MSKHTATIHEDEIFSSIAYKELLKKKTAFEYYKSNGASDRILDLVSMNARSYGCFAEKFIRSHFGMEYPSNTEHDAILLDRSIELKAPRMGATGKYFIQHIKPYHDFQYILISLLLFNGYSSFILTKTQAMQLLSDQRGEGYFIYHRDLEEHATVIENADELRNFIKKHRTKSWVLND